MTSWFNLRHDPGALGSPSALHRQRAQPHSGVGMDDIPTGEGGARNNNVGLISMLFFRQRDVDADGTTEIVELVARGPIMRVELLQSLSDRRQ